MGLPDALAEQLVTAHRILAGGGQGDLVWGHISLRDPDGRGVWMKPSGIGMEEVEQEDLLLVSPDGDVEEGEGRRHSEYPIHTEVLAARPDVGCVVHTHPPETTAFAALDEPLRPVSHEGSYFVPPGVPRFTQTTDLIRSRSQGRSLAEALGGSAALFLRNHGVVVVGADAVDATVAAILLERACALQLRVLSTGEPYSWTPPDEAEHKRANVYTRPQLESAWEYLRRLHSGARLNMSNCLP
jgi:L-ribulose-5-phosphate 4-epimerase